MKLTGAGVAMDRPFRLRALLIAGLAVSLFCSGMLAHAGATPAGETRKQLIFLEQLNSNGLPLFDVNVQRPIIRETLDLETGQKCKVGTTPSGACSVVDPRNPDAFVWMQCSADWQCGTETTDNAGVCTTILPDAPVSASEPPDGRADRCDVPPYDISVGLHGSLGEPILFQVRNCGAGNPNLPLVKHLDTAPMACMDGSVSSVPFTDSFFNATPMNADDTLIIQTCPLQLPGFPALPRSTFKIGNVECTAGDNAPPACNNFNYGGQTAAFEYQRAPFKAVDTFQASATGVITGLSRFIPVSQLPSLPTLPVHGMLYRYAASTDRYIPVGAPTRVEIPLQNGGKHVTTVRSLHLGFSPFGDGLYLTDALPSRSTTDPVLTFVADGDGDALPDRWEIPTPFPFESGAQFCGAAPSDEAGGRRTEVAYDGASQFKKDLFLEIDWMTATDLGLGNHSHRPEKANIQAIVDAFANAPVANPDGSTGIKLHVDMGLRRVPVTTRSGTTVSVELGNTRTTIPEVTPIGSFTTNDEYDWSAFQALKDVYFDNAESGRRRVYRYAIMAHSGPTDSKGGGFQGIARGIPGAGREGAGDFLFTPDSGTNDLDEQATIMHELGHTLGLQHGGGDSINRKPNYLSVMNYHFSGGGLIRDGDEGFMDYSRWELPGLNENSLTDGFGFRLDELSATDRAEVVNGRYSSRIPARNFCFFGGDTTEVDVDNSVDWDCDLSNQQNHAVDINDDGCPEETDQACIDELDSWGGALTYAQITSLRSFDDWSNISYAGFGDIGNNSRDQLPDEPLTLPNTEPEPEPVILRTYSALLSGQSADSQYGGASVTYRFTLRNAGTSADVYQLSLLDPLGWVSVSDFSGSVALAPGEEATLGITVVYPADLPEGTINEITAGARSQANPLVQERLTLQAEIGVPPVEPPTVDIGPGKVNLAAKGVLPVSLFGTAGFSVREVNVSTLAFGPGGAKRAHTNGPHFGFVDGDGIEDLTVHFRVQEIGLVPGAQTLCLTGEMGSGEPFSLCDRVTATTR